ncbi:MAG: molybdenum cofactor guanylyltransferase [Neptuniibacter sp.]
MSRSDFNMAAVILSGGQGSRMGGQDKGLILIDGRPMVMRALELAARFTRTFVISCNRNQSTYSQFKCKLIADQLSDFQGPLAGIHSALSHFEQDFSHLLVLPCDTPWLNETLLAELVTAAKNNPSSICYLATKDRPQFLHAVIPAALTSSLNSWLESGERAVYKWYRQHPVVEVKVADNSESLRNINTQSDVQ